MCTSMSWPTAGEEIYLSKALKVKAIWKGLFYTIHPLAIYFLSWFVPKFGLPFLVFIMWLIWAKLSYFYDVLNAYFFCIQWFFMFDLFSCFIFLLDFFDMKTFQLCSAVQEIMVKENVHLWVMFNHSVYIPQRVFGVSCKVRRNSPEIHYPSPLIVESNVI